MKTVKNIFASHFWCLVLLAALSSAAAAQPAGKAAAVKAQPTASGFATQKLVSKLTGREMPYIVVLPPSYQQNPNQRFPVLYLLHGLTGHYDNWTTKTKLGEYVKKHEIIIVTPEGENGWYVDGATNPNDRFESYIADELIPEIDRKYRTRAERAGRAVAGLSMGGYGALKFGLKHPDKFVFAGSMSGALGAASWSGLMLTAAGGWLKKPIETAFGANPETETRRVNDIFRLARETANEQKARLPFLYLDCGTEDFLYNENRQFAAVLVEKKIPHEFRQMPGGHNWDYWDKQVQEILRLSERFFAAQPAIQAASAK